MRLSVLALFVALPAAAYAIVYPRQDGGTGGEAQSQSPPTCLPSGDSCEANLDCCSQACYHNVRVHFL